MPAQTIFNGQSDWKTTHAYLSKRTARMKTSSPVNLRKNYRNRPIIRDKQIAKNKFDQQIITMLVKHKTESKTI